MTSGSCGSTSPCFTKSVHKSAKLKADDRVDEQRVVILGQISNGAKQDRAENGSAEGEEIVVTREASDLVVGGKLHDHRQFDVHAGPAESGACQKSDHDNLLDKQGRGACHVHA